ncbi:hypothetical protein FD755_011135, partial [Muntiacus reevesi]
QEQSELDQDLDDVEEVEEEETGEETKIKARQLTVQMMQNPQILAAVQERLDGLVETPTGYIEIKCAQIEAKFYEEVHDLERKCAVLYQPLFDKQYETSEELKEKARIEDEKKDKEKEDPKGIPEFWLSVFKNVDLLNADQPASFVLEFHNEYFTNEVLTKTYRMRSEPDYSDPFSFDGPEIMGWKNVTLKTIKKQQKHKGRGTVRTVTKTSGDLDDDSETILTADFEIGHFLHEHVIQRSVEISFTGEATEGDDDYDEEGEEADEEGEEEGDDENDPGYNSKKDQNPADCK